MGKSKEKKKHLETQNTQYEELNFNDKPHNEDDDGVNSLPQKKKKKNKNKEEELTVAIENIEENPEKISPIIGYFSSGYNPLNEDRETMPKVTVSKNVRRNNRYEVVVSPNQSQVKFVGTNYSGEATAPQICTYALGVLDKSTGTLKVVPITANKIFRLEPRFAELENKGQDKEMEELTEEQKKAEEKSKVDMYISKKNIRANKKRALLHQHDDPETQKDIDKKIEGLQINEEALEVTQITTNSRNIPPHDMDATSSNLIYPLNKIIFNGEWDHLMDIFHLSQEGTDIGTNMYPKFVCNRFYKLDHVQDETEKSKLAGILSYITHLIMFKDKHSMEGVSTAKSHKIPSLLFQKFSSMFSDSGSKKLANDKLDLLISYVLVLTLFVDDFRSDPLDIAADLRMSSMKLRAHYELLGCKLVREKQVLLATLPAPLQFTMKYKRKR